MLTVLVTGAQGFVGRALCDRLVADGYDVKRIVRSSRDLNEVAIGEMGSDTNWYPHVIGCAVVVHLAARVHVMDDASEDPLQAYRQTNTYATLNLARQASEAGVRRFVYLSSVKVNGESGRFTGMEIPSPCDPYASSKWEAEQGLLKLATKSEMEVVILRPPLVYGPEVRANFLRLMHWVDWGVPLPFAMVHNQRSMIFLGNLVDAILQAILRPECAGKTYLLSDGEDVSTPDLIRKIAAAFGKRANLWSLPMNVLRWLGMLSGKSAEVDRLVGSLQVDNRDFIRDLEWRPPYSLDEGVKETVNWYRKANPR